MDLNVEIEILPCLCGDPMAAYQSGDGKLHVVYHLGPTCGLTTPAASLSRNGAVLEWNAVVRAARGRPRP